LIVQCQRQWQHRSSEYLASLGWLDLTWFASFIMSVRFEISCWDYWTISDQSMLRISREVFVSMHLHLKNHYPRIRAISLQDHYITRMAWMNIANDMAPKEPFIRIGLQVWPQWWWFPAICSQNP
jgi:hypothetical protein